MPQLNLINILPCLQILKSVTSIQGDTVHFNIIDKSTTLYSYDKVRELQIYGNFSKSVVVKDEDCCFHISLTRFLALIKGHKEIGIKFGKEGLKCVAKNFSSTIEAGVGDEIELPNIDKGKIALSKLIYEWVSLVKLNTLFKKEDMLVFIKYDDIKQYFYVCCADNWHTALLTIKYEDAFLKSFNLALPFRYLEYANKLIASEDNPAHLYLDGNNTYFFNNFITIKAPTVSIDSEQVNIEAVIDYTKVAKGELNTSLDSVNKISTFINQSKSIAETDRDNQIKLTLEKGKLCLFVETKHGRLKSEMVIEGGSKGQITVNAKALLDLVSRIPEDSKVFMSIQNNTLYLVYKLDKARIELTTLGTSDGD